jgi:hypothetical protein
MAKIVLGVGTSHSPMLSTRPEQWPEHTKRDHANPALWAWDGRPHDFPELAAMTPAAVAVESSPESWARRHAACQDAIAQVAQVIREAAPDVLVVVGDDQKEVISDENMPAMLVYWGDTVVNRPRDPQRLPPSIRLAQWSNEFEEPREFPVQSDLALHIIQSLMADEFDLAHSKMLPEGHGEGHAFGFIHRRILEGAKVPMVPIMLNTYYPPTQPTPNRCYNLGVGLKKAIESWESDARVAVLASGGLSHFVIDETLDRAVLAALEAKDDAYLRTIPTNLLNAGNSEIRNWIAVAGAVSDLDFHLIDYVPCYRSEASTGCAMGFAYWD